MEIHLANENPISTESLLVSVIILTYNSGSTIRATLDSLSCQYYANLELIFCDDGSTDDSVSIVRAWIERHALSFKRTLLLESPINEGICRNIGKGYAAAEGTWLKPIAGDDILMPGAIRKYVDNALGTSASVVFSGLVPFRTGDTIVDPLSSALPAFQSCSPHIVTEDPGLVLQKLIVSNFLPAPAAFILRKAYEEVGGVDPSFKHLDDWPLWIKFLRKGKTFHVFDDKLVWYRTDSSLTTERRLATQINRDYLLDLARFYVLYQKPYLPAIHRLERSVEVIRWKLAAGRLRKYPLLYKATRLLHVFSPVAWSRLWLSLVTSTSAR